MRYIGLKIESAIQAVGVLFARNLTAKQAAFAGRVAAGQTVIGAFREVYQPVDGKAASAYSNAKRARKHPGIAARIKELQLELMPAPQDMRQIYEHGMAVALQLSVGSPDHRVRLRAAQWLCAESEKRERLTSETVPRAPSQPMPTEAVIANLRELYRKAGMSPLAQEPLVVEVAEDKTSEAGSAADRENAEEGLPPAEQESPPMSYRTIPGQFPQKEQKYDELTQYLRTAIGERGVGRKEQEPLVVDGELPGVEPNDSAAETPENADEWEPDPVSEQSAATATDAVEPALEGLVPKMEYRLAPVPGAFPMRFQRVKTS